jgi:hypothetical protein
MLGRILRIGLWAIGGAIVVYLWVVVVMVLSFSFPRYLNVVATITVPASLFWQNSTSPPNPYFLMFLNGVTYGVVGLSIELLLRLRSQHRQFR